LFITDKHLFLTELNNSTYIAMPGVIISVIDKANQQVNRNTWPRCMKNLCCYRLVELQLLRPGNRTLKQQRTHQKAQQIQMKKSTCLRICSQQWWWQQIRTTVHFTQCSSCCLLRR